jgi:hypothetical protein
MSRFTDVSVDPSLTRRVVMIAFAFAPLIFGSLLISGLCFSR